MKYIFEDDERDILSIFFRQAYPTTQSSNFIYARGNCNLEDKIKNELENNNEHILVFMDMVPGNRELIKCYNKYKKLSRDNNFRVIVLPIICAEYYLIKALKDTPALSNSCGVDICINKEVYFNSPVITDARDRNYCKNFEKYCKLILMKNTKYCATHSGKTTNEFYGAYYTKDCICKFKDAACKKEHTVLEKAINYIKQYPCIPCGSYLKNVITLYSDDLWNVHRQLVNDYNIMTGRYKLIDKNNIMKYKTITPFK